MERTGSLGSDIGAVGLGTIAAAAIAVVAQTALLPLSAEASDGTPHVELACQLDYCTVEATYSLPTRRDGHRVQLRWESRPATGHTDNDGDVVERTVLAGSGERRGDGGDYLYRVTDTIWHSDIRCDDAIRVQVSADGYVSGSASIWKAVPDDPRRAFCSDYGMASETS